MKDFLLSVRYIRLHFEKGSCMSQLKFGSPACLQILIFCNTTFLIIGCWDASMKDTCEWRLHEEGCNSSLLLLHEVFSYFNLIANLVALIRYFLFNQCYVKRDMGSCAQRHPGSVGIIYLEMNIMQLSLKTNSRVFFVFLLLILTTHLWNTASQWSFFLSNTKLNRCSLKSQPPGRPLLPWQAPPDWGIWGRHFIPADGRITTLGIGVRPKVYYGHHWEWHGKLGDSHSSGTSIRSQQVNYGPKPSYQLERCCNSTVVQVGLPALTKSHWENWNILCHSLACSELLVYMAHTVLDKMPRFFFFSTLSSTSLFLSKELESPGKPSLDS